MSRQKFKFKSSGVRRSENRPLRNVKVVLNPIGIKTPMRFSDSATEFYDMHTNPIDQIKDNLRNVIMTNHGERLGRANFGANLSEILFDMTAITNFESQAIQKIQRAVEKSVPAVTIKGVSVSSQNSSREANRSKDSLSIALITLRVQFDILPLQVFNQILDVSLFVGG